MVHMTPLCDHNIADEDAIMSVEGGVGVGESAAPRRAGMNQKSIVGDVYCYMTDIPWRECDAHALVYLLEDVRAIINSG